MAGISWLATLSRRCWIGNNCGGLGRLASQSPQQECYEKLMIRIAAIALLLLVAALARYSFR